MTACPLPRLPKADFVLTDIAVPVGVDSVTITESMDAVIADGRIAALAPDAAKQFSHGIRINGRGLLLLPGFVNAHTHSCETLRRGIKPGATLDHWIPAIWQSIDRLPRQDISIAVMLGAVEMLKRGVTAVIDHFRQIPMRLDAINAAATAYRRSGLRATIAIMLRDMEEDGVRQAHDALPDAKEQILLCAEAIERHRRRAKSSKNPGARAERVSFALGPSAPLRCSDDLLVSAAAVAASHSTLLHMHVDETCDQSLRAQQRYRKSAIHHLRELGILGPNVSLAHAVWIHPADIELLAESKTVVVHNPVSNMRLGSGRAAVAAMRRAGVTVALGTDGAASNDGQDLLEAAKFAVMLSRTGTGIDAEDWLQPCDALQMATEGGRVALGLPPGGLAPGIAADVIAVELNSPALVPLNDVEAQLVLGGPSIQTRHVFVDGRWVVRDGVVTQIDETALYAEARAITRHFAERAAS